MPERTEGRVGTRIRPNVPIAIQVANALRKRLRQEYADGGRLPGEPEMASQLGVSRGTLRQALAILQQEGAIYRQQGLGTFVNPHILGIQARIDFAYEFGQLIEAAGFDAARRTLEIRPDTADSEVARRLDLDAGAPVLLVRKLFLAGGQPAIYVHEHLPTELITEPYELSDLERPMFGFIEQYCHTPVDYVLSEIVPARSESPVAELLDVPDGSPMLKFVEVFHGRKNQPLVLATIYFRDPLIRFHALRKVSQLA